jgi:hypothetical protein
VSYCGKGAYLANHSKNFSRLGQGHRHRDTGRMPMILWARRRPTFPITAEVVEEASGCAHRFPSVTFWGRIRPDPTICLVSRSSPGHEFESLRRPHLSRRKLLGAFVRAILLTLAAALASWIRPVSAQPLDFAVRYGLVVGLVGLLIGTLSGFTEWYTDNLPERRLGLLGICLITGCRCQFWFWLG